MYNSLSYRESNKIHIKIFYITENEQAISLPGTQ